MKFFAVASSLVLAGYLLLLANGISVAMRERAQGWQITPMPSHPVAHMILYVTAALALQLVSAWLLMPAVTPGSAEHAARQRFWASYAARLIACVAGSIVGALVLWFLVMALLDAGVL